MWRIQLSVSLIVLSYQSLTMEKPGSHEKSSRLSEVVAEETETQAQKLQNLKKSWTEKVGICVAQTMMDLHVQGYDFMAQPHAQADDYANFVNLEIEKKIAELLPKLNQCIEQLVESEKDLTSNATKLLKKSNNLRPTGECTLALQNISTLQTTLFESLVTLGCYQELRNNKVITEINKSAQKMMLNSNP